MPSDDRFIQDPASGYASADVLDPNAQVNRDRGREGRTQESRDAMSGYASADALTARGAPGEPKAAPHAEPVQDALSGYASADVLDTPGSAENR